MAKEKTISLRITSDTEHKLMWLLKETNSRDIGYTKQTMSDIIETAIHNEWISRNMANLAWREKEILVDEEYTRLIKERSEK